MFGERLKSLRKSLNLTQKELGEKLNVSGRVVVYYESNDRFPDKDTLTKIAYRRIIRRNYFSNLRSKRSYA